MEATVPTSIGKKLWHMLRVMYYMLCKGISKHKLMVDLHLLLKRGKITGKAIDNFLHHHGSNATAASGFSCRSMDPNTSFYNPRDVEFSCSNTPSLPALAATKRKNRHHYKCDAAAIAKAFEILNSEVAAPEHGSPAATPSRCPVFNLGNSPVGVDKEAEDFIRRFYEQLSLQQHIAATPEYRYRQKPLAGRA